MITEELGACHNDKIPETVIELMESEVCSFYNKPITDIYLESLKVLPDLDWTEPYTGVFKHLILKETDTDDPASAYLYADLGTDPDCQKNNEHLNIEYKNLCYKLGAFASENFMKHLRSKNISLNNCGIDHRDFYAICQTLYDVALVNMLDVAHNNIGAQGAHCLSQLVQEKEVNKLNLDSNKIGDFGCTSLISSLVNTETTFLSLSNNGMGDRCVGSLNEVLRGEKSKIKDLFLDHNQIGQSLTKSAKDFKVLFATNVSLDNVNFSGNNINAEQAVGVFIGLKNNNTISYLDLSNNGIGNSVCKSIGTCLKQNHSLQSLDLSSNFISVEGVKAICNGLKHNDCLNTLKIGKNPIDPVGTWSLLSAINNETSAMTALHLHFLDVSVEFVALLAEVRETREMEVVHGRVVKLSTMPKGPPNKQKAKSK